MGYSVAPVMSRIYTQYGGPSHWGKVQPCRGIPSHHKTATQERNQVPGDCPDAPNLLNAFIPMSSAGYFQKIEPLSPLKINANQPGAEFTFLKGQ